METAICRGAGARPGDRILKVDHAGEHGAVCVYRAQSWVARWRAPDLCDELRDFLRHERRHRALFATELKRRGVRRCRSYHLCGLGGLLLGSLSGLLGRNAVAATTVAIERVVLRHLDQQLRLLKSSDPEAAAVIGHIVADEQEHHDVSLARGDRDSWWTKIFDPVVALSTEMVIWLGMRI